MELCERWQAQRQDVLDEKRETQNRERRNALRRARDQAMRDLGMVKVRGALGGTYWE